MVAEIGRHVMHLGKNRVDADWSRRVFLTVRLSKSSNASVVGA